MLSKKFRLKKYSAFIATYKNNNKISDKNISIYFGKEKTSPDITTKFAFVVSKKTHKRAVVRNRIKRLMREVIKQIIKENKYIYIHKYMSLILVGNPFSVNASINDIRNSINELLTTKGI